MRCRIRGIITDSHTSQPGGNDESPLYGGGSEGAGEPVLARWLVRMSSLMRRWMLLMSRFQAGFLRAGFPRASDRAAMCALLASMSMPSRRHCSESTCDTKQLWLRHSRNNATTCERTSALQHPKYMTNDH